MYINVKIYIQKYTYINVKNIHTHSVCMYNLYTIYTIHPFEVYNSVDFSKGLAFLCLHISAQLLPMIFLTIISFPLLFT